MIFAGLKFFGPVPTTVIRVTGEDAFTFLQGQFTNELRQPIGSATYGLWLDQKGKVLADSHVLRVSENEFLLVSAYSAAPLVQQRLESYVVADDVTLVDESAKTAGLVLLGEHAGDAIEKIIGGRPTAKKFSFGAETIAFLGRRAGAENFEVVGAARALQEIQKQLRAMGGEAISADELESGRIAAGIPRIPVDVGPGDLPNEAGLEDFAISYTKGCYLGQEVMARLKNLGKVRRRLHVVRGPGKPPATGAALFQGEKKVGEIRSSAPRGNEFIALAMLSLINFQPRTGLSLAPAEPATMTAESHG